MHTKHDVIVDILSILWLSNLVLNFKDLHLRADVVVTKSDFRFPGLIFYQY